MPVPPGVPRTATIWGLNPDAEPLGCCYRARTSLSAAASTDAAAGFSVPRSSIDRDRRDYEIRSGRTGVRRAVGPAAQLSRCREYPRVRRFAPLIIRWWSRLPGATVRRGCSSSGERRCMDEGEQTGRKRLRGNRRARRSHRMAAQARVAQIGRGTAGCEQAGVSAHHQASGSGVVIVARPSWVA